MSISPRASVNGYTNQQFEGQTSKASINGYTNQQYERQSSKTSNGTHSRQASDGSYDGRKFETQPSLIKRQSSRERHRSEDTDPRRPSRIDSRSRPVKKHKGRNCIMECLMVFCGP